jgi:hypothetical protein
MNTDATPGALGSNDQLGLLVEAAGMVNVLNHGSGSCVYSEGCHGVTQEHLERFAELVRANERKVRNQLGELPDPSFTYERRPAGCEPERVGAYTADQLKAYAAQERADERKKCIDLCIAQRLTFEVGTSNESAYGEGVEGCIAALGGPAETYGLGA